jgi:hypothetical protein
MDLPVVTVWSFFVSMYSRAQKINSNWKNLGGCWKGAQKTEAAMWEGKSRYKGYNQQPRASGKDYGHSRTRWSIDWVVVHRKRLGCCTGSGEDWTQHLTQKIGSELLWTHHLLGRPWRITRHFISTPTPRLGPDTKIYQDKLRFGKKPWERRERLRGKWA